MPAPARERAGRPSPGSAPSFETLGIRPVNVIDGHAHVGGWREPGFAGRATTLADADAVYRRCGFAGALVTTTDRGDNATLRRAIEEHAGALRFRLAYWVDPAVEDDLGILDEMMPSVAALKIHPSFLRRPIGDPAFRPYLERAARHGRPVVVHCGRWQEMAGYGLALDVAASMPGVSFVLGHMGGDEPLLVRRTVAAIRARGIANASLGTESVRQYWVVREAIDALGAERVVFGSDYNLNHPAMFRAVIEALELDAASAARVLGGNLERLLPPSLRFFPGERPGE